jgi:hypothetical protein
MARSYRHNPIIGITLAKSEKEDKRFANRTLRAASRLALVNCQDYDDLVLPLMREVSNVWSFAKDGKQRLRPDCPYTAKYMRK